MSKLYGNIAITLEDPDLLALKNAKNVLETIIGKLENPGLDPLMTPPPGGTPAMKKVEKQPEAQPVQEPAPSPQQPAAPPAEKATEEAKTTKKRTTYTHSDLEELAGLWQMLVPEYCKGPYGLEPTADIIKRFTPERKEAALLGKAEINSTFKTMLAGLMGMGATPETAHIKSFMEVWQEYKKREYPEMEQFNKDYAGWKPLKAHPDLLAHLKGMLEKAKGFHEALAAEFND